MKIVDLLRKRNLLTKEIYNINYHMDLLSCRIEDLEIKIPELKGKSEDELVVIIMDLFDKCNSLSPNYDSEVDLEMTRIGLKTDVFYGGHNRNKWLYDEDVCFGNESNFYDDYIDSQSGSKRL